MLDLFNIAKPQGCDIQTFYGNGANSLPIFSWAKPRGVSNIYMLLIGAGGQGDATTGGGSGSVTVWYGSANNVPDNLAILIGTSGSASIVYQRNSGGLTQLVRANSSSTTTGGSATSAGVFAASGFYQSIAGQNGSAGAVSASSTTFLSGGTQGGSTINANYGYDVTGAGPKKDGYFLMQPIIVGLAASGSGNGGIGCGSGAAATPGIGGPGMVLIASW